MTIKAENCSKVNTLRVRQASNRDARCGSSLDRWLPDRHSKRIEVRFLDFLLSDICVWQECPSLQHFFIRVCSTSYGSMDIFAMVADSKVFIVARNKHVVPKRRRVERLPSGYSVRESRDDSQGSYWYVVTAFDVVRPRDT